MSDEVLLSLIESIYEAAGDAARWPDFLAAFANAVHGTLTTFIFQDISGRSGSLSASVNFDPEWAAKYETYYSSINVWMLEGGNRIRPGVIGTSDDFAPSALVRKSEFYADYLRPMNVFQQIGGAIVRDGSRIAAITSMRPEDADPFSQSDIRLAAALMPHLQRALDLHERLSRCEQQRDSAVAALERSPYGTFLLDSDGTVVAMNDAGRKIVASADGIRLCSNRLQLNSAAGSYHLDGAIAQAARTSEGVGFSPGATMTVERPSQRRPYIVSISPLARRQSFTAESPGATVGVFIADSDAVMTCPDEILMALYGLTRAEAAVASLLIAGMSTDEAASARGVARETVRSHVRQILAKTNTRRQVELVRKLTLETEMFRRSRAERC